MRDITILDQAILEEMREKTFDRIIGAIAIASLAGGLLTLMVNGVSSPGFLYAVTLLLGLIVVYLLRVTGLFVVAAYFLLLLLIGLVSGLLFQFAPVANFIPYLFIPVVIIAGLILSPPAALITTAGSILVTLVITISTGHFAWPELVTPFGLTILTALLIAEGGRYINTLDRNWLKTKETLRTQHWEILEVLKQSDRLQQRAVKLEQKLLQFQSDGDPKKATTDQKEALYGLVKGAVRELKVLAQDLETFVEEVNQQAPFNGKSELLETAWHKLDHLTNLIVNLEEMAFLKSGEISLRYQANDVATLIGEVAGTTRGLARGKNITVRHQVPEGLPKLYADPYRLRQALLHVLSNAVKYTDEGIVNIEVELHDSELMIIISDTGIGLERPDQEQIFEPFGRAGGPEALSRQGVGLGLSLSEQLIKLHNGRIWVSSVSGIGSTFYIALSLATESDKPSVAVPRLPAVAVPAPDDVPALVRQPIRGFVPSAKHTLGPVARFSTTYIGRFGLALIGLLLIIGLAVIVLALYNVVDQEEDRVVTASSLPSNEIAGLPLNPTRRPSPTSTPAVTPSMTSGQIEQLPATPTLPPTATTAPSKSARTVTPPPTPTATSTATPSPSPSPSSTSTPMPPPTLTPSPTSTATPVSVPAALSSPTAEIKEQSLSFVTAEGLIRKTNIGRSSEPGLTSAANEVATAINHAGLSWSPTGELLFTTELDGNREIYLMQADGSRSQRLTSAAGDDVQPAWSPDGRRIAFSSGRSGNFEIYVMSADGQSPVRLTGSRGFDEWPAWSPDGRRLAFVSDRDGNVEIYTMKADGSEQQRLTDHPANDWPVAWSPDGQRLVFSSDRDGDWNLYLIEAAGGRPVRLTNDPANERDPVWSPDGRTIAFAYDGDGNWEIYTVPAPTAGFFTELPRRNWSRITTTPSDERYPAWAP